MPLEFPNLTVVNHPLIQHKLTWMRSRDTHTDGFRKLLREVSQLLAYEATRDVRVDPVVVQTPVAPYNGVKLARPRPIIIPVLRAGLGMLEGMTKLLPTAEVGFLGIKRNEETLEPYTYANRLPDDLNGRQVFIIDPMLATGGTLMDSIDYVFERGATDVTCVCLLGAPEGLAAVEVHVAGYVAKGHDVKIVLGALDEKLNEKGYIVPGLGDAGDRLYGVAE